jgi:pilus assembly protein CpaC
MHPNRYARRTVLWGMVLAAGLCVTTSFGQDPKQPAAVPAQLDAKTGAVIVPLGGLVSFDPKSKDDLTDVVVSNENVVVVKVDPTNPKLLLLTGRQTGLAQMTLSFKDAPRKTYDIVVQPDLALLRNIIKRTVPTAAVDVSPGIGQMIILSGYVTSPQDADTVGRLAISAAGGANSVINAVQVGGVQQVQIDVVVARVNRRLARSRGFDFFTEGTEFRFASILSGLLSPTGAIQGGNLLFQKTSGDPFFAAIQALRTEGIIKFIAEPRVVTQTGRPAFFRAGGQQAILSQTAGITGPGVQLVPFGTELEVLPIVYANGQIWLELNPRITVPNPGLGISVGNAQSTGFDEQILRTAVMLESGQTFAIGGLIQNSVRAVSNKVPVLGDLPFVGIGFSRVEHEQVEEELLILVTPRLVGPMNCDQVPKRLPGRETRNPDDYELFLENILEAPRGQRKVWANRCYNAAWKCDPTAAIFPCIGALCTGGHGGACGPLAGGCASPVPVGPVPAVPPVAVPAVLPSTSGEASSPVIVVPQVPGN